MSQRLGDRLERAYPVDLTPVFTANVSGSVRVNTAQFEAFNYTMTGNTTFTLINPMPGHLVVVAIQIAGAFTVTWGTTILWPAASTPVYSTPATYVLWTMTGGTQWRGRIVGGGFA